MKLNITFTWKAFGINFKSKFETVAIVALFCTFALFPFNVNAAAGNQDDPRKVLIVIKDFDMKSGNIRFKGLERGFVELFTVGFLSHRPIEIVPRRTLWRTLISDVRAPFVEYQQNEKRIFQEDVIERIDPDYVLSGNYIEREGRILLRLYLEDWRSKKREKIGNFNIVAHQLLERIDDVALSIVKVLARRNALDIEPRQFTISCFAVESQSAFSSAPAYIQDLSSFLVLDIAARSKLQIVKWNLGEKTCVSHKDNIKWQDYPDVDAIIGGLITHKSSILYVKPTIYIRDPNFPIEILPIEGSLENYLELKLKISQKLKSFIEAILSPEGKWRVDILQKTPRNSSAYMIAGDSLIDDETHDPELAAYFLEWAIHWASTPDSSEEDRDLLPELYYLLGRIKLNQKGTKEAENHFKHSIQLDNSFLDAYLALGDIYFNKNNYDDAKVYYENAKTINPMSFEPYDRIATIYLLNDKYDLAQREYEKAIELNSENARSHQGLASVLRERGAYERAANTYKLALTKATAAQEKSIKEDLADTYFKIGTQKRTIGLKKRLAGEEKLAKKYFVEAVPYFNESLAYIEMKKKAKVYSELASIWIYLREWDQANDSYTKAIDISNKNPLYYTGRAYLNLARPDSRYDKVILDCDQAIKYDDRYAKAYKMRGIAYYMLANTYKDNDRIDKYLSNAAEDFRKAAHNSSYKYNIAGALENVGLVLLKRNEWRKLLENTQLVNEIYDKMAWNWFFRYIAASELKKEKEALEARNNWLKYRNDNDIKNLKRYLPKKAHKYLR